MRWILLAACLLMAVPAEAAITAVYLGVDADVTGDYTVGPDGKQDHHVRVSGLQAKPIVKRRLAGITGPYVAELPKNAAFNWIMAVTGAGTGTEEWWSSTWTTMSPFRATVTYSDGTTDVVDVAMVAPPQPPPPPPVGTTTFPGTVTAQGFISNGPPPHALWTMPTPFAALGTPLDGTIMYCSDCQAAPVCSGGGAGAFAKRARGAWQCN